MRLLLALFCAVLCSTPPATAEDGSGRLVLIDSGVADAKFLASSFPEGSTVLFLGPGEGLDQIAEIASHYANLSSISIVSHGGPGEIILNRRSYDKRSIGHGAWQSLARSMAPGGDLLLYGCNVGAGVAGQTFVADLARATGRDVAASSDVTGAAGMGGNWSLERRTGSISQASLIDASRAVRWNGLLGQIITNGGLSGTSGWTLTNGNTGNGGVYWNADSGTGSLSQTGISGWNNGFGSNGAVALTFSLGWNNFGSDNNVSATFTISVAGTTYATVTTGRTGLNPNTATIVYQNGASGSPGTMNSTTYLNWTGQTVTINLPASVSASGNLVFAFNAGSGGGDDIFIDNISAFTKTSVTIANTTNGSETGPTSGVLTVTQSGTEAVDTVINLSYAGAATNGSDYTRPTTVTIPAGQTSATITLPVIDDLLVEGDEDAVVTLAGIQSGQSVLGSTVTATNRIADNDTATVSIATQNNGNETGPSNGSFTISLSKASATDTVVNYNIAGSATAGSDYTALSGSITIPANTTSVTLPVPVIDDAAVESSEDVIATLTSTNNGLITIASGATASASVSIADNDQPGFQVSGGPLTVSESGSAAPFTVVLTAQPLTDVVITISPSDTGEASAGATTLTFTPANWNQPQSVTVTGVDDALVDGDIASTMTVAVSPSASDPGFGSLPAQTVDVTTLDNDTATISITTATNGDEAGATGGSFTVSISQPSATPTVITYSIAGTATAGSDYSGLTGTVTIPANATSITIPFIVTDDPTVEGDETVVVTLTGPASGTVQVATGSSATATATIADNDLPQINVSVTDGSATEGGDTGGFALVLESAPTSDVTISIGGSAQCSFSPSTVTFTPANWNQAQSIVVTAIDDSAAEGSHSCAPSAIQATGDGYTNVSATPPTIDVNDNDQAGIKIVTDAAGAAEGGAPGSISVVLESAPTSNVTVSFGPSPQCNFEPDPLTFTAANWNLPQILSVIAIDDTDVEGDHSCSPSSVSASGGGYDDVTVPPPVVGVADNDEDSASDVVRRSFESATYNFLSRRLDLIASHEPKIFRLVNRDELGNATGSNGFNVDYDGGHLSGDFALSARSIAQRLSVADDSTITPTADLPARENGSFDVWLEGQVSWFSDDRGDPNEDGNFFIGYAGVDMQVSERLLIGIMGELDWMTENASTANGEDRGTGWMIGPYLTSQPFDNIFFDARAMWGRSNNSTSQDVFGVNYDGDYETDRWLVEAKLSGQHAIENLMFTPDLMFLYMQESQENFDVEGGGTSIGIGQQDVRLGQLSAGLKASYLQSYEDYEIEPYVGGRIAWDFDNPDLQEANGNFIGTNAVQGSALIGFDVRSGNGQLTFEGQYDGIGSEGFEAITGKMMFVYKF